MAGTVFLSCGQNDRELAIAHQIGALLQAEPFGLTVFIARSTNNLLSLNADVVTKLAYADYVIFVNFCRKNARFPGSIYAHQELAMAIALGHAELLIYSEKGAPKSGIIQFAVQNRRPFANAKELLAQVRLDVERAGWRSTYSRFLRVSHLERRQPIGFLDGAGNGLRGPSIGVVIENESRDLQDSVIVTLETLDGREPHYMFRSPLKVSGQRQYDAAIPPSSSLIFDIIMEGTCTAHEQTVSGVFLISALDLSPLPPLFSDEEEHVMEFRIDARARQPVRFKIRRRNGQYALE